MGLDGAELDSTERWIVDWQSGFEEHAAQARALSQRMAELTVTATSGDGAVEVTVDSSGALMDLRLDETIRHRSAADTAKQILACTRTALTGLAEQASAAVDESVGRDSAAGRAVLAAYHDRLSRPVEDRDAAR